MAGAILFTLIFAMGGSIPVFTMAWVGNRMVQAIGWPGMVKIVSRWFPFSSYGTAMGIVSLSYLWGDSAGRYGMGLLLRKGVDWRGVFFIAAGMLSALLVLNLAIWLRESPERARAGGAGDHADQRLRQGRGRPDARRASSSCSCPCSGAPSSGWSAGSRSA